MNFKDNMGVQGTALIKAERSHYGQDVHHAVLRSRDVQWFSGKSGTQGSKKRKLDTTIEARSHTDVSGYLSSISILMLGPHYGGELPKWKSLCDPYHVPVVVIPQDIYAQLNGDALIQLALDTLGK